MCEFGAGEFGAASRRGRSRSQPQQPLGVVAEDTARRLVVDTGMLGHHLDRMLIAHVEAVVAAEHDPIGADQIDQIR